MRLNSIKSSKLIVLIIFLLCYAIIGRSQDPTSLKKSPKIKQKNLIGIELSGSILPKATINRLGGIYQLESNLQSSYDLGIIYTIFQNADLRLISGLHFVIGKRNYYATIPASDFPSPMNITNDLYIEDKFTWSRFRIPVVLKFHSFQTQLRTLLN